MTVAPPTRIDPKLEQVFVDSLADAPSGASPTLEAPPAVAPALGVPDLGRPLTAPEPIEASEQPARTKELLIICESGDLERTWATTILASSAAASGVNVSIFFTFWGFFPLVRPGVRITGENWMQKMLSVMNRPGIDHAKLSRLNFMGMGPWMMKRLAKQHGVAEPGELLTMAQELGVRLIPCQMSMDMMGLRREDLIDGLEKPAGAATVIEMITSGATPIFV